MLEPRVEKTIEKEPTKKLETIEDKKRETKIYKMEKKF